MYALYNRKKIEILDLLLDIRSSVCAYHNMAVELANSGSVCLSQKRGREWKELCTTLSNDQKRGRELDTIRRELDIIHEMVFDELLSLLDVAQEYIYSLNISREQLICYALCSVPCCDVNVKRVKYDKNNYISENQCNMLTRSAAYFFHDFNSIIGSVIFDYEIIFQICAFNDVAFLHLLKQYDILLPRIFYETEDYMYGNTPHYSPVTSLDKEVITTIRSYVDKTFDDMWANILFKPVINRNRQQVIIKHVTI